MPIGLFHRLEHFGNVLVRNVFVKEITHGIHKDHPRLFPCKRLQESFGVQCQIKTLFKRMARHSPKTL
jgi:hypothetical protein